MSCPLNVQTPFPGRFDQRDLRWVTRPLTAGPNKGQPVAEAYIPFQRFNDFYEEYKNSSYISNWSIQTVDMRMRYKQAYKAAGFQTNRKAEALVTSAVIAAQAIPDSFVKLLDSSGAVAQVSSMQDRNVTYEVTDAGTPTARCTCPQGVLHYMCMHVVKIITFSQGYTEAQIIQALGTRAGTSMQGLVSCNYTAAQAETQLDPLAQLEDIFALTGEETEQEAAATSQLVLASAPVPAPSHDSAACQQQVETAVKRMWDMVADDDEMQQHLVSQLNRTEGALSKIQACQQNGSAHPMARLTRVQDTWGNSLVRKKVIGLDVGFPKSKRSKTAEQPAAMEAGQTAEPELNHSASLSPQRKSWARGSRSKLQVQLLSRRTAQQQPMPLQCQLRDQRPQQKGPAGSGCPTLRGCPSAGRAVIALTRS